MTLASPADAASTGAAAGPGALTASAVASPNPSSKSSAKTSTKVVLAPAMQRRLQHAHVPLKAVGGASKGKDAAGRTVLRLPNTGTHQTEPAFTHRGGVVLGHTHHRLRLDQIRVNLQDRVVSARVDRDGRADMFRVSPGSSADQARRITLTKTTAKLLDAEFGTHRFEPGQRFGTVQMPERLGSGSSFSETIQITNSSRYKLQLADIDAGKGTVTSGGKQTLQPSPGYPTDDTTDTITYTSNAASGGLVQITYRIDGTELTAVALFQVPTLGFNEAACTQNSYIDYTTCHIDGGYHPTATWDIVINPAEAPFPDLGVGTITWKFHKIGAPGSKGLQVNNAALEDGATVSISDNTDQLHFNWVWNAVGDAGWGELINQGTAKCLERNSTTGVVDQSTCVGSDNQLWKSVWNKAGGGSALELKDNGQYLGVDVAPGSITDGTIPVLRDGLDQYTSWGAETVD
jgi:hypothetical protein